MNVQHTSATAIGGFVSIDKHIEAFPMFPPNAVRACVLLRGLPLFASKTVVLHQK